MTVMELTFTVKWRDVWEAWIYEERPGANAAPFTAGRRVVARLVASTEEQAREKALNFIGEGQRPLTDDLHGTRT